jgi:NADH dehydrogenase (ubiquinone) 1 alpha subcomplex subunit 9
LVLPYRCDETDVQHLRTMGDLGMIVPQENFNMRDRDAVKAAVDGVDIVVNLIGADHETWNYTFEDVHVRWAETLARACGDASVERVLHFSALGAGSSAPSKRLRTKHQGDEIIRDAMGDASTIFKPAPITGPEDRLFRKFASQIKKMPFVPLVNGGKQRVQPIWVRDVALAVQNALQTYESLGKEYELAGPEVFTMKELADFSFNTIRERPNMVPLPLQVAKLLAAPGDALAGKTPLRLRFAGWSQDSVEETQADLVLQDSGSLTAADLDVNVHKVTEGIPIEFLRHYRSGGYDLGSVGSEGASSFTAPPHVG